jgi:hypothetical protein
LSSCPKDPDIQQLAYTFKIDAGLTQKLNDIMIEKRHSAERVTFSLTSQSTAHVRAAFQQPIHVNMLPQDEYVGARSGATL